MLSQSNVVARIRLPELYDAQKIFGNWQRIYPKAQVLVAPCGTKVGKSYGSAQWLTTRALVEPGSYNTWIGPTYLKCKIGFRYMRSFLPDLPGIKTIESKMEITLDNGSIIKLLHGKDAETTVEGEAIDNFVIDESGKQQKQLWFSLLTTLTQTRGCGIVTGTPRGFNWYYDVLRKAKAGDPFYCWAQIATRMSPYVSKDAIEHARRLLPKALFDQYYEALFVTSGSVFGDIQSIWDPSALVKDPAAKFWIHPDASARSLDTCTGWDIAKHRDYSVFYTVNTKGMCVGYARFRKVPYEVQVDRLAHYVHKYFTGDRSVRYDATGVGDAVGEMVSEKDIDASFTPVVFSNKSKQEMVSRTNHAIESGWHKAPRLEQIEHEFGSFEVSVTKSGLFSYSAPDGEHDDVVCAAMLGITGAYQSQQAEESDKVLERIMSGNMGDDDYDDNLTVAASEFAGDDGFFNEESEDDQTDDFSFED